MKRMFISAIATMFISGVLVWLGLCREAQAMYLPVEHVSKYARYESRIPMPVHRPGQPSGMSQRADITKKFLRSFAKALDKHLAKLRRRDAGLRAWIVPLPKQPNTSGELALFFYGTFGCRGVGVPRTTITLQTTLPPTPLARDVGAFLLRRFWRRYCGARKGSARGIKSFLNELAGAKDAGLVQSLESSLRFLMTRKHRSRLLKIASRNQIAAQAAIRLAAELPGTRATHLLPLLKGCKQDRCRMVVVTLMASPGGLAALRKRKSRRKLFQRIKRQGERNSAAWLRLMKL